MVEENGQSNKASKGEQHGVVDPAIASDFFQRFVDHKNLSQASEQSEAGVNEDSNFMDKDNKLSSESKIGLQRKTCP